MKVSNWRRKLAASLVAGGLMAPTAVYAQNLNTNLVQNPSFENVGATECCYSARNILSWTDGTQTGFAYDIAQGYDNGGPLAGGGSFYFTSNAEGNHVFGGFEEDITRPGQVSQNIQVAGGQTGPQISSGQAALNMSAFFTSYLDNNDVGNLHVEFLNASDVSLGALQISAKSPITGWHQRSKATLVPPGTTRLKASVFGTPVTFGPDGYIDLVDVRVTDAINDLLYVEVNTTNGQVRLKNNSGDPVRIDYYEIKVPGTGGLTGDYNGNGKVDAADYVVWRKTNINGQQGYNDWRANFDSAANSLNATAWNSLQEQNLPGFPAGNGSGNGWEQGGGSGGSVLSESFLTGNSVVANAANINLGSAFNVGSPQNLEFRYVVVPEDGSPSELIRGFVRYVTAGAGTVGSVPEPSAVLMVGIGLASLAVGSRKSNPKSNS
ncbi:MAG TPA: PEP-CTERM sorting domain-containing protein [Lacipirellulaceae bacterium]|nr:PEP-CTERM sorting domain-containing protein [Lacipirellulaceae bacterium]